MTRRPLCLVCVVLILFLCLADFAGLPLIRGNPVSKETDSWIREHPQATIYGEVVQTTDNSFSQSIYLRDAYLIIRSKKIPIENIKVYLKEKEDVPMGTVVLVSGELKPIEEMRNPGEFDSPQYYACEHIYYVLKKGKILKQSETYSVYKEGVQQCKNWLKTVLERIAGEEAGVFQAIVLGDKSNLEETTKLRYQMAGIVHILAISGLHISVIGSGLYNLLMKTGLGIWLSGFVSLVVMLQYGILTGGSVSTMRAVCMYLIMLGAKITGRIYDLPTALAVSAMLLVWESGAYLYSSGFLLSFSAVLGAGVAAPYLNRCFFKGAKKGFPNTVLSSVVSSLAVQGMMLPVSLYFFGEVSLAGFFLNFLVLPSVGVLLGSGVLGLAAGCLWENLGKVLIFPGCMLGKVYEWLCRIAGNLPMCTWILGQPKFWQIAVYYACFLLGLVLWGKSGRKRKRSAFLGGVGAGLWILGLCVLVWRGKPSLSVTCLDVGQGDAVVVRTPENNCFLIDGGSSDKSGVGQYKLLPYLKNQGIQRLDGIFVTHTDNDHISGIKELLELSVEKLNPLKIKALYLPCWKAPPKEWEELKELAGKAGVLVRELKTGNQLKAGKLQIQVLAPFETAVGADVNEEGMVLLVKYEEFSGLFTGDIGEETERKLLEKGLLQDVDFLKVGHHGSRYSTCQAFLDELKPEIAVISCAEENSYGHPAAEVVERLQQAGCQIGFTMKSGAVTLEKEGERWKFRGYVKAAGK